PAVPGPAVNQPAVPEKKEAPAPAAELQGEVTVGAVLPLTGDGAAYGLPIQKAIQLAVDEVNAVRGAGGKKLVVAYEDGKCDGKEGATAAQKLIGVNKVQAIIGGVCSGETLGFAPIANENKVVVISPSATSPDITTKGGDYVFRFAPSDALAGKVAVGYAKGELQAKRAAVISENSDYAQALRRTFTSAFKLAGGVVAMDEAYNTGVTDFRTQALKIKNAKVDVVYVVPQTPAPGIAIVKALKDKKVTAAILTAEVLIGRDVAKENSEVLEGVVGFEAFYNENSERAARFTQAYKDRYAEDPAFPFFMANAYSEVYLLRDLLEKDGNDGVKMQKTLTTLIKGWAGGALTDVTLDKNGDIEWKSYSVKEIKGGAVTEKSVITL
ncbi:hypothetical protein EPN90_03340, partial [Patescibacteria group bacterium]